MSTTISFILQQSVLAVPFVAASSIQDQSRQNLRAAKLFTKEECKIFFKEKTHELSIFFRNSYGVWEEHSEKPVHQIQMNRWRVQICLSMAVIELIMSRIYFLALPEGTAVIMGITALKLIPLVKKVASLALYHFKWEKVRAAMKARYKRMKQPLLKVTAYAKGSLPFCFMYQRFGLDLHQWKWTIGLMGLGYLLNRWANAQRGKENSKPWGGVSILQDDHMWLLKTLLEVETFIKKPIDTASNGEWIEKRRKDVQELVENIRQESLLRLTEDTGKSLEKYLMYVETKFSSTEIHSDSSSDSSDSEL